MLSSRPKHFGSYHWFSGLIQNVRAGIADPGPLGSNAGRDMSSRPARGYPYWQPAVVAQVLKGPTSCKTPSAAIM